MRLKLRTHNDGGIVVDTKELVKKMNGFISFEEKKLEERIIDVKKMSFVNLRDSLIGLGTILDEDFELNSYILSIRSVFANQNSAIVAIQLSGDKIIILGYAKEGLINQHTAKKAIDKVIKSLSEFKK